MSQDILTALSQEAISRMNPYQCVEWAVGVRSEMHNGLGIKPVELENGSTLYTVTSGLAAVDSIDQETVVEGGELVRRQFVALPLTAFADVVELQPPTGDTDGCAKLYRVEEPIAATLAETRRPFQATAVELITTPDPVYGMSPIRFNGVTNAFYTVHPEIKHAGETYMSSEYGQGHVPVQAGQQTDIQLQIVGRDELDHELGVLAFVSGVARVALGVGHLARITNTGILYGPSENKIAEINIPADTPQYNTSDFHRIPDDATVGPNEAGNLVPQGERASGKKYEHTMLNPSIDLATALELMPSDTIDWTDGTDAFIKTLFNRIAHMMPLDVQDSYEQTLRTARDRIREASLLLANHEPTVGRVGCLAVTARLAELPATINDTRRVDAEYFGISS